MKRIISEEGTSVSISVNFFEDAQVAFLSEESIAEIDSYTMKQYESQIKSTQGADYVPWQIAQVVLSRLFPTVVLPSIQDSLITIRLEDGACILFNFVFTMYDSSGVVYTIGSPQAYPVMEQYGRHSGIIDPDPKQLVTSYLRGLVRAIAMTFGIFRSLYLEEHELDAPAVEDAKGSKKSKGKLPASRKQIEEDEYDDDEEYEDDDIEEEKPKKDKFRTSDNQGSRQRSRRSSRDVEVDL